MAFLAPLAAPLAIGAALFGGVSAFQQGQYQNQVAKNNAQIAERNAVLESEASQIEGMRSDQDYAAALGEQLAAQGASGFDILGRTQLATRARQQRTGRDAAGDIHARGTASARGLLQDAANFRSEGSAAKTQGAVSLFGSVLDAGSIATKGYRKTQLRKAGFSRGVK